MSNFSSNNDIEYDSNGDRNKTLTVEEYLEKTGPYVNNIINILKKSDKWKIQLTIANKFISSINNNEDYVMDSKRDNIETMIANKADELIKELFDSLKIDIRIIWNQWKAVSYSSLRFIYCIINDII